MRDHHKHCHCSLGEHDHYGAASTDTTAGPTTTAVSKADVRSKGAW
jgi:hypothetical protein